MNSFARQADCFHNGDTNGFNVFFKAFPQGVPRFFCCKHNRLLAKGIHSRREPFETCQELLRDGKWLFPYWDLDAHLGAADPTLREKVMTDFEKLCAKVFPYLNETFNSEFLEWSDSSGDTPSGYKLSLHAVYTDPRIGFEYNRANKDGRDARRSLNEFGQLSILHSEPFDALWYNKDEGGSVKRTCMIDGNVWTTNRCMRCVGCHKPGNSRVLLPIVNGETDRLFTRSDIEAHLIGRTTPPHTPCVINQCVQLSANPKRVVYTRTVLQQIAKKLGCEIDKVETNLVTLKTKPGGRVCPITNERYLPGNNRCYLTMKSGEIFYNQFGVTGQLKMGEIKSKKTYEYFSDITKLHALHKRLGDNFTLEHIKTYLRESIIYIRTAFNQMYIVKVDGYKYGYGFTDIVEQFQYRSGPVKEGLFGKGGPRFRIKTGKTSKFIKLDTVLEHMRGDNQLVSYNNECWIPFSVNMPYLGKNVFNKFVPFSLLGYSSKPVKPFPHHAIYTLMKKDLTGDHPQAFNYLLDYIAHKLQKPNIRIETALCFIRTVQGVGKGQLAKWLTMLFDERNCKTVANLDHLFGRFNAHLQSSLWCFLEEIKSKGSAWEHCGRLKDLISSTSQLWEKKYQETENGSWYGQIVIFSNDSYGIRIENCDRRYVVFDTNYHHRDNKKLHDLVASQTMCPDHMAEAFRFFMERDVANWNWREIPDTATRTAVKECCENVFLSFTRWLFESEANYQSVYFHVEEHRVEIKNGIAYTYNAHLIAAFRQYKTVTHHPSKVDYKRQIIDGITQLWGPCWVRKRHNGQRGIRINLLQLQEELSRQFRGPVILEIVNNDKPSSGGKVDYSRLSPFDGPVGTEEGNA